MQQSPGAIIEVEQAIAVVFQLPALDKRRQVRTDMGNLQPCNVFCEVLSVRADIAHTAGTAALFRVGPPGGLLLAGLL